MLCFYLSEQTNGRIYIIKKLRRRYVGRDEGLWDFATTSSVVVVVVFAAANSWCSPCSFCFTIWHVVILFKFLLSFSPTFSLLWILPVWGFLLNRGIIYFYGDLLNWTSKLVTEPRGPKSQAHKCHFLQSHK